MRIELQAPTAGLEEEVMLQRVDEPVAVITAWPDHNQTKAAPRLMQWKGQVYKLRELGMHFPRRSGSKLWHVFTVTDETHCFRLELDSETLLWKLTEISDGLPA